MPKGYDSIGKPKSSKNKADYKVDGDRKGNCRPKKKVEMLESNLMKHIGLEKITIILERVKLQ